MRSIPLDVILSWPKPNYVDPETRGPAGIIVSLVLAIIAVPLVGLRLYTRAVMRRKLGLDDLFCTLAMILSVSLSLLCTIAAFQFHSIGHVWDVPLNLFVINLKYWMATKLVFIWAGTFIRQSLLCLYCRLVSEAGMKAFRFAVYGSTIFNIGMGILFTCLVVFACIPFSDNFILPTPEHCLDDSLITFWCGIVVVITDFLVLLLPVPVILRLQITRRQKIGVVILLNLGLLASVAAIVRTYFVWKSLLGSYDVTWWAYPLWICAVVEVNLAIYASCAPALRPWVIQHTPWLLRPFRRLASKLTSRDSSSKSGQDSDQMISLRETEHAGELGMVSSGHTAYSSDDANEMVTFGLKAQDLETGWHGESNYKNTAG